jgi:hypothetical protein
MNKESKLGLLGVFGVIAVIVAFACVYGNQTEPTPVPKREPVSITWNTSAYLEPPDDTPIVGYWVDGNQPIIVAVVCVNNKYYEYDPNVNHPVTLLFGYPPIQWAEMPGGAK